MLREAVSKLFEVIAEFVRIPKSSHRVGSLTTSATVLKQMALRALLNWLLEPMDFPGKTYHLDPGFATHTKR